MYELVEVKENEVFTTSKVIAAGTNNKHHSITAIIQKYECEFEGKVRFEMEPLPSGQKEKVYLLNEEQATFLMTLLRNDGVNGVIVGFKKRLVSEFFRMREFIRQKQTDEWQKTRLESKENRLKETDVIKLLAKYAKEQGSTHSDKLYIVYTKLVKGVVDGNRDDLSVFELNNITLLENVILQTIRTDMLMGLHYKDIYKDCKERIDIIAEKAYLKQNSNKALLTK